MSKVRKAIIDARELRNKAIEEAKEALIKNLNPAISQLLKEQAEVEDDEEIDIEDDAEIDFEELKSEVCAAVSRQLAEKEQAFDDFENDLTDEDPLDDEEIEFSAELEEIRIRYGLSENKLLEIVKGVMGNLLSEVWKYPSITLYREGKLRKIYKENSDEELDYSDDDELDDDIGKLEFDEDFNELDDNGFPIDEEDETEDEDEIEFDLEQIMREASATGDIDGYAGGRAFDSEDFDDDEEIDEDEDDEEEDDADFTTEGLRRPGGLRRAVNKLLNEQADPEDDIEIEDDDDLLNDEEDDDDEELDLEGIVAEIEAEMDDADEDDIENMSVEERTVYEAGKNLKSSLRDWRRQPFSHNKYGNPLGSPRVSRTNSLLVEQQEKVIDKYGEGAILRNNVISERLRKIAGIKINEEMSDATGISKAKQIVENLDNPIKGVTLRRNDPRDLIQE